MKVTVNKCPDTGKLFEDDKKYKLHRAKVLREKKSVAREKAIKNNFFDWLADEKKSIITVDMIVPWFMKNQRTIMDAANAGLRWPSSPWSTYSSKFRDDDVYENVSITSVRYSKTVSNTHNCPVGGVTNFMCRDDLPQGYEGWWCRISGTLVRTGKMYEYPYSSGLHLVGINTGSGGGGNEDWSYDAKIFLADWPGLQHEIDIAEQDEIVKRLKGQR